jgi:hypothetical protein
MMEEIGKSPVVGGKSPVVGGKSPVVGGKSLVFSCFFMLFASKSAHVRLLSLMIPSMIHPRRLEDLSENDPIFHCRAW